MTRSEQERTHIVRAWLGEGGSELPQNVLDGVLQEVPTTAQDRPVWSARRPRTNTMVSVLTVAAAVIVVVITGTRLLPEGDGRGSSPALPSPTEAPTPAPGTIDRSYREVGYIGLPPLGAVSSDPERTDLVENFWLPRNSGAGYRGAAFVYADGRMIWNEYYAVVSASTGWLEQRLTDEGIELIRGLGAQTSEADVPRRLDPALLPNLLPASAWADRTVRPYVPSRIAACVFVADRVTRGGAIHVEHDASASLPQMLAMLPGEARDLLVNRTPLPAGQDEYRVCLGMPTADARRLDAALRDGGLEQDASRNTWLLEYHTDLDGDEPEDRWLNIWFEPILPDGTITCSSCG